MKSKEFEILQKDVVVTYRVRKKDGTIRNWALFKSYFNIILRSMSILLQEDQLIEHYEFLKKILEEREIIPDEEQLRGFLWKFACNDGKTNERELRNLETMEEPLNMVWEFQVEIGKTMETKTLGLAWIVKMSQMLDVSFEDIDKVMFDVIDQIENKHYDDEIHFRDRLLNKLRKKTDTYENQYDALQ